MINQIQVQQYEQQSIKRSLCASCSRKVESSETHCCEHCAEMFYRDPNGHMTEEDDDGTT